jgi:hypothetical protein
MRVRRTYNERDKRDKRALFNRLVNASCFLPGKNDKIGSEFFGMIAPSISKVITGSFSPTLRIRVFLRLCTGCARARTQRRKMGQSDDEGYETHGPA